MLFSKLSNFIGVIRVVLRISVTYLIALKIPSKTNEISFTRIFKYPFKDEVESKKYFTYECVLQTYKYK